MKRIDAVIRRERFEQVKKALDKVDCPGMMVFTFRGHGRQKGMIDRFNGRRFKLSLIPKVLLTIFAVDEDVPKITEAIEGNAKTGKIGDGKIFIAPVENALRIRTGEHGASAI